MKISQEMIDLYDDYTHESLDRRRFLTRLTQLAGSTAAAMAILPLIEASTVQAAQIAANDPHLLTARVNFGKAMQGYEVRPKDHAGPLPAVIVIHENRGLNPHIEDVARRAAMAGFLALAPDFLSPMGGTPAESDEARSMIGKLDRDETLANAVAAVDYLKNHDHSNGKVGAVGFCWGGGMVNRLAAATPNLDAGVAFYGRVGDADTAAQIKAKLMLHYAGLDDRINAGIAAYEASLKAAGVDYQIHMYDGVNHAFHNDTSQARYDEAAAKLAWQRTVEFFKKVLASA